MSSRYQSHRVDWRTSWKHHNEERVCRRWIQAPHRGVDAGKNGFNRLRVTAPHNDGFDTSHSPSCLSRNHGGDPSSGLRSPGHIIRTSHLASTYSGSIELSGQTGQTFGTNAPQAVRREAKALIRSVANN